MIRVALAGVRPGLGYNILDSTFDSGQLQVVVLPRSSKPELGASGVGVGKVDYNDHYGLVAALGGVHMVLSTIGGYGADGVRTLQLAL